MGWEEALSRYEAELEAELQASIPSGEGLTAFYGMLRYHLGWVDEGFRPTRRGSGKKLRPTLCLLACEAVGGDYHRALPAAAALELVHGFSLIHDDIQDRSVERRHRPTVWKLWGEAQAINAGDAMYVLAHLASFRLLERSVPKELALAVMKRLHQSSLALSAGQYLDLCFESRLDITPEMYFSMIARKTAALIACSTQLGALLGSEQVEVAEKYRSFGEQLGIAYQVQDDILGLWGEEKVTGKAAGDDVRQRKKTLPVIHGLEKAQGEKRETLFQTYRAERVSEERVATVIRILTELGARKYAEEVAQEWYRKALETLAQACPHPWAEEQLRAVAAFLMGRSY